MRKESTKIANGKETRVLGKEVTTLTGPSLPRCRRRG